MSVDDEAGPDWAGMADAAGGAQAPGSRFDCPACSEGPYEDPDREEDRTRRCSEESAAMRARWKAAGERRRAFIRAKRAGSLYREGLLLGYPANREEVEPPPDESREARRARLEWERTRQGLGRWWMRFCQWKEFKAADEAAGVEASAALDIELTLTYNAGIMPQVEAVAAVKIAERFEGALLAMKGTGKGASRFLRWDGCRWVVDVGETLANKAVNDFWHALHWALDWIRFLLVGQIEEELTAAKPASSKDEKDLRKDLEKKYYGKLVPFDKFYTHLGSAAGRRAVKELLAEVPGVLVGREDLDIDPHLLNSPNGTLDLRTMEFRDCDPADRITLSTAASYEPGAPCPEFTKHLERFLPDVEVRTYLQRLVGYGLLGEVRHHLLPMLVGDGSNGKGTLIRALQAALGGYMIEVSAEMLLNQNNPSHPTDLMDLRGARIVSMQEIALNRSLNAAKMKSLTGGDRIRAHWMHANNEEFSPSHLFLVSTNHTPRPEEFDGGVWRRIRIIPFEVMLPKEEEDSEIDHKLAAEAEGVLAWAVEGYRQYQALGGRLPEPAAVLDATEGYREESDAFRAFGDGHLVPVEGARTTPAAILLRWKTWADQHGERLVVSHRTLREHMKRIGYTKWRKSGSVRFYEDVELREETWEDMVRSVP